MTACHCSTTTFCMSCYPLFLMGIPDPFQVTGGVANSRKIPTLCGTNTGQVGLVEARITWMAILTSPASDLHSHPQLPCPAVCRGGHPGPVLALPSCLSPPPLSRCPEHQGSGGYGSPSTPVIGASFLAPRLVFLTPHDSSTCPLSMTSPALPWLLKDVSSTTPASRERSPGLLLRKSAFTLVPH